MLNLSNELVLPLVSALASAAAVWGGIRTDIKHIHAKLETVKRDADEAHERLDRHLEQSARR